SGYSPDPKAPSASGLPGSSVGSYVPGAGVQVYNDGTGAPVPAGGKLRYSMHYTTNGKAATDHTEIGYYLLKTPPEIIRRSAPAPARPATPRFPISNSRRTRFSTRSTRTPTTAAIMSS